MARNLKSKVAICTALCAMSVISLSASVGASEWPGIPSRVVNFADLDLTRSAGVAALYARIQLAARHVCEPVVPRDLGSEQRGRACAAHAVEQAVADVNAPQLTSYHQEKQGTKAPIVVARSN
jgi:UrcA family protein